MPRCGVPDSTSHGVGSKEGVRMALQDCMTLQELVAARSGISSIRMARRLAKKGVFGEPIRYAGKILVLRSAAMETVIPDRHFVQGSLLPTAA
ncbi:MAG: hypothetical protein Q7R48_04160 [bacterium]|nr:hypothetical protein [bacterium]